MLDNELLDSVKRIHFVGIGGSGMSPLAEILHARGYQITGSDVNESDNVNRIKALGIPVIMEQKAENVGETDLVVYTSAVNPKNPELVAAKENDIPIVERGKLLGMITHRYGRTIGVAGTHGKTTTTSMISQILLQAELDPTLFIGGRLPMINANGRAGGSDIMVCEACEFQDHYLSMLPAVSVILNVDADHLDYFGNLDNVIASFHKFAGLAKNAIIVNADDDNAMKAISQITNKEIIRYGMKDDSDWSAKNCRMNRGAYGEYDLYHQGKFFASIQLGVPGAHNIGNSMAAAAAAYWCGATAEQIAEGLSTFHGAGRRFEFLGTFNGVTIADDYAHHPTEIAATLDAAKNLGYQRVWAIFQPFTFSRTAQHLDEFVETLSAADIVVLSEIMGSREENIYGVSSKQITDRIPGSFYLPTFQEISDYVASHAEQGDLILTMGGGDIYKCARMIAEKLGK